ncbi:hypothetical protein HYV86_06805 [Candidatus Woesearchaeota archaeon]|nr:hypothetical protein [Candidatus Woesearchaeota archaeon]
MFTKKTFLAIAIALLFALFIGYGIEVFHKAPDFDACYRSQPQYPEMLNETSCLSLNGTWVIPSSQNTPEKAPGYCNYGDPCYTKLEGQRESHDRIVFIVSLIVGILGLVSMLLLKMEIISTGISAGAILLLLYGTIRYWQYAQDVLRFTLIGVALAILIYVAYSKLDQSKHTSR